ncbi:hypothetical protein RD792_015276 [Penstemon davidsonii]|uniref:Histone deacetylase interacting domain-containing protein n=1 Tax=Penstemon davidsonii TaxID=160366 RepID=A0ABR0CSJ4_9LAMI|nr:hypothetical protein RD792_015276 [Penstemon davidsonii]
MSTSRRTQGLTTINAMTHLNDVEKKTHHDSEQSNCVRKGKGKRKDRDNNERKQDDIFDHKMKSARRDATESNVKTKDVPRRKLPPYLRKEKCTVEPIRELDLSNCERCTPSYRLLPENYPIPSASCRTTVEDEVLNDQWACVASGSDHSFQNMLENKYEEVLFRCEDDRLEPLLSCMTSP